MTLIKRKWYFVRNTITVIVVPRSRTQRKRKRRLTAHSLAPFLRWLAARGFRNPARLAARSFPGTGRGLLCRRAVPANGLLLRIPRSLLLSSEAALTVISSCTACRQHGLRVSCMGSPERLLSLFLAHERLRGRDSAWAPYIASLPLAFDLLPCWEATEVALAPQDLRSGHEAATAAFEAALEADRPLLEAMGRAHGPVQPRSLLLWARNAVNSRCVFCPAPLSCPVLVPFLDLLNHDPNARVDIGFSDGHLELKALDGVSKNSQALISYGPHDSAALLAEYGFLAAQNPHDVVPISITDLQRCFGLQKAEIHAKALELCVQIDPAGFSRPLCFLSTGTTYYCLKLLHSLLQESTEFLDEDEMAHILQGPLVTLIDQLQTELRISLQLLSAAAQRNYRLDCLQSLLQGRSDILKACRTAILRLS